MLKVIDVDVKQLRTGEWTLRVLVGEYFGAEDSFVRIKTFANPKDAYETAELLLKILNDVGGLSDSEIED